MRYKLTPEIISKLKPPTSGSKIYFGNVPGAKGGAVPGFAVRTNYGGKKVYLYVYRFAGKQKKLVIAGCDEMSVYEALDAAREHQAKLRKRIDPAAEVRKNCTTVADLVDVYKADDETLKKRAGTLRNETGIFKRIILPKLGEMTVEGVGQKDISKLHGSLKATPYHANRTLALLSILFEFAIAKGHRTDNPAKGVRHYPESPRNRWLSPDELERLSAGISAYPNQATANAIRLLAMTGARENEVLRATWSEFDLTHGIWTKPSHHTKAKRLEHVQLGDDALALLRKMAKNKTGDYLFPGSSGDKPRVTIRKPWVQICKTAGLATEVRIKGKRRELVRYKPTLKVQELRHNFASHLVSKGVSLYRVGQLLGHTQPSTTQRYSHLSDVSQREAANMFPKL
jgi:integrase